MSIVIKVSAVALSNMMCAVEHAWDLPDYTHGVLIDPHPSGQGANLVYSSGAFLVAWHDAAAEVNKRVLISESVDFSAWLKRLARDPRARVSLHDSFAFPSEVLTHEKIDPPFEVPKLATGSAIGLKLWRRHMPIRQKNDFPNDIGFDKALLRRVQKVTGLFDFAYLGRHGNSHGLMVVGQNAPVVAIVMPVANLKPNDLASKNLRVADVPFIPRTDVPAAVARIRQICGL